MLCQSSQLDFISRQNTCNHEDLNLHFLDSTENQVCNTHSCTLWGEWTSWGDCDRRCDGKRNRHRECLWSQVFISIHVFFN